MKTDWATHVIFSTCLQCGAQVAEFAAQLLRQPELICAGCHHRFQACPALLRQVAEEALVPYRPDYPVSTV